MLHENEWVLQGLGMPQYYNVYIYIYIEVYHIVCDKNRPWKTSISFSLPWILPTNF